MGKAWRCLAVGRGKWGCLFWILGGQARYRVSNCWRLSARSHDPAHDMHATMHQPYCSQLLEITMGSLWVVYELQEFNHMGHVREMRLHSKTVDSMLFFVISHYETPLQGRITMTDMEFD